MCNPFENIFLQNLYSSDGANYRHYIDMSRNRVTGLLKTLSPCDVQGIIKF